MKIINRLGEELIARKQQILDYYTSGDANPFAIEDTVYIINEKYFKGRLINEEIKENLLNNKISIPEFENLLLKDIKYKKTKEQIEEEIAIFASKLLEQIKLQDVPITRDEIRISSDLQSLEIYKTMKITKQFMQAYVGLENNPESYLKIASKCIVPFFILRMKKIMLDFSRSELLRSNYIKVDFSPVYTKNEKDINEPIMIDFIIRININTIEKDECYNDIASYIRTATEQLELYFQERTIE